MHIPKFRGRMKYQYLAYFFGLTMVWDAFPRMTAEAFSLVPTLQQAPSTQTKTIGKNWHRAISRSSKPFTSFQSKEEDEENLNDDLPQVNNEKNEETPSPEEPSKRKKSGMATVGDVLLTLQSGFIFIFAGAVGIGLILNLLGYGYIFNPDTSDGGFFLRIDTIDELRLERQLQQASTTIAPTSRPDGGISEFFLKNPFTFSLILTAVVLGYGNLVYDGNSKDKKKK